MATQGIDLSDFDPSDFPNTQDFKFGIVKAKWNSEITNSLYDGAMASFLATGTLAENIISIEVPGAFELVYGAKLLCKNKDLDAVVVIGNVIQGETKHFDYVCEAVSQGIKDLNVHQDIPVIFCVLTDNNMEQSKARSGGKHGNKGIECASAALEMAILRREFSKK